MSHLLPYYYLKFTFVRLLTDCLMYSLENDDISKRVNIFSKFMLRVLQNLYLILLWAKFAPNCTNIKQIRKGVSVAPSNPTSKKTNFSRVPELTSLKLSWITITITSLKMFQYNHNYQRFLSLKRFFTGVIFISNGCSISNNIKKPVKLQPTVKNEAVYYLSTMKANA